MTVGDKIYRDGQYEFQSATGDHSILMNGDSLPQIKVIKFEGLFGLPDQRKTDLDRQAADGLIPGTAFLGGKPLIADVVLLANNEYDMHQLLMDVAEALQPDNEDGMLVFQKSRIGKRVIFCRPERFSLPSTYEVTKGTGRGVIQFIAHDPRIYSFYEEQVSITIPPGQTSGQATAHMGGNWKRGVPCTIAVNGPGENPRIANAAHFNRQIKFDTTLASDKVLVIHTGRLTVEDYPSGDDESTLLADDSQWWDLQKGDNVITVNRDSTVGTLEATVTWRNAFTL